MTDARALEAAREEGIRLLTGCLWASTFGVAILGLLIGSGDIWLASGFTALLNLVPTWNWMRGRRGKSARVSFGVAVALHPAVYVFLLRGHPWQMDLHMYFFAALAALTVLYDGRPLLVAAGIIIIHHLVLQVLAPSLAFAGNVDFGRVLMHAGIVLLQTMALSVLTTRLATVVSRHEGALRHSEALADAAAASEERTRIALAERDIDYRLLAEHSNDVVVRLGVDGRRRYVSPASESLLGYAPDEMVGRSPLAAIHVDDRKHVVDVFRAVLQGSENRTCIYREQHRDGRDVWIEASYRLVRNHAGDPIEVVANVRDITQRKIAEHAAAVATTELQESNRLMTMAMSIAHVGHWRLDLARNETSWSDEVCRIHGIAPGFRPSLENAIDAYHPADRQMVNDIITRAIEKGGDFEFTATLLLSDGSARRVVSNGQAVRGHDGAVIELFGVFQDISAQAVAQDAIRESEERYRLLAENATDLVFRTDENGIVVYASPSCPEVATYAPEELIGKFCGDFLHPDDGKVVHIANMALVTGEKNAVTVQYRLRCKDGSWRWLESHMKPWRGSGNEVSGVISAIRDVSARKALEAELVMARETAEGATQAKSSFLAMMSHEIRTPMTGVLGMVELLRSDDVAPEERERFFTTLERSAKTLMTVLDDVLDYSKIESGSLVLETVDFDIADLAHNVGDLFQQTASAKGLAFSVNTPSSDIYVRGDPTRIQQILSNLVSNAIKFTETGGVVITVGSTPVSNGARRWRIEISDTGVGLGMQDSQKLFSPFVQADESTTRRFGGTGLGLAISKRLIDAMGGDISVQARAEGGSTFWFEATLDTSKSVPFEAKRRADRAGKSAVPLRVLIAEDNTINQLLLSALLRRLGHHSACVANGELAVSEIQSGVYDVILMDMQMPVMDGVAATRAIRGLAGDVATVPVIALTADALPERRRFYENVGLSEFLTKPVDVDRLAAALGQIVPRRMSPREMPVAASLDIERLAELSSVLADDTMTVLLDMIAYQASTKPAIIRGLCEAGELTEALQEAHGLKGAAGNIGAVQLAEAAAIIEKSPDITTAMSALPRLEFAAIALLEALESYKAAPPAAEFK